MQTSGTLECLCSSGSARVEVGLSFAARSSAAERCVSVSREKVFPFLCGRSGWIADDRRVHAVKKVDKHDLKKIIILTLCCTLC